MVPKVLDRAPAALHFAVGDHALRDDLGRAQIEKQPRLLLARLTVGLRALVAPLQQTGGRGFKRDPQLLFNLSVKAWLNLRYFRGQLIHLSEIGPGVVQLRVGLLDSEAPLQSFAGLGDLQIQAVFPRLGDAESRLEPACPFTPLARLCLELEVQWLPVRRLDLNLGSGDFRQRPQVTAEQLCLHRNQLLRWEFPPHDDHAAAALPGQVARTRVASQLGPEAFVIDFPVLSQTPGLAGAEIDHLAVAERHGHQIGLLLLAIVNPRPWVGKRGDHRGTWLDIAYGVVAIKPAHHRCIDLGTAREELLPAGQRLLGFLIQLEELHFGVGTRKMEAPGVGGWPLAFKHAVLQDHGVQVKDRPETVPVVEARELRGIHRRGHDN